MATASPEPIAEILERAASLIEPEGAWAQYASAYDASGRNTYTTDPEATCWCAYGAIVRLGGTLGTVSAADDAVAPRIGSIIQFNDAPGRTQAEVVAKLREAAALAKAKDA